MGAVQSDLLPPGSLLFSHTLLLPDGVDGLHPQPHMLLTCLPAWLEHDLPEVKPECVGMAVEQSYVVVMLRA